MTVSAAGSEIPSPPAQSGISPSDLIPAGIDQHTGLVNLFDLYKALLYNYSYNPDLKYFFLLRASIHHKYSSG